MKRVLSIFIAVIMVAAMVLPTTAVFADEEVAFDPFAGDHVAGEMPANLFQDPTNAMVIASNVPSSIVRGSCSDWRSYYLTTNTDFVATGSGHNKGLTGTVLLANNAANVSYPEKLVAGKAYVYSFEAMNYGTTDSFVYNMCLGSSSDWGANWSVERGADGFVISDKENWTKVAGTLVMRGTAGDNTKTSYLCSGFQNAKAGSSIRIRHNADNAPYLAEESPYDILFAAKGDNTVIKGIPAEFEAKLVNQINSTGTLAQNVFTFSVFGADGNAVEGLTVSEDGVVSATDAVADGTYYVRATAQIDETTAWNKTLELRVLGAIENTDDYVVGEMPPNLFQKPNDAMIVASVNTTDTTKLTRGTTTWTTYWLKAEQDLLASTNPGKQAWNKGLYGTQLATNTPANVSFPEHLVGGKAYVYSFVAKNNGTTDSFVYNMVMGSANNWGGNYSIEHGADGFVVSDKENWNTFAGTLVVPGTGSGFSYLTCGFQDAKAGSSIIVSYNQKDNKPPYLAEEVAYDIIVDGASDTIATGESINLSASVKNQIGSTGTLAQSFDWVAVTPDRMDYVDGITFEPSNDGANVVVKVDEEVAAGEYIIVAQSTAYDMNRQYPITVTVPTYDVTELTLNTGSATAVLEALTVNTDKTVKVVIAAFAGNKVVTSDKTEITPVDGVAALTDPLAISGLSAGDKVRVFVWDELLAPFSMKSAWKTPITIE